jgi:hypothetical protein
MVAPSHIVSLTFDDALDVHLDIGIPLLEEYGFRGTFYVTVGAPSFTQRIDDWRCAAANGHELGNHTIFHPAWRHKSYVTDGNAIETYTLDRMRLELESANRILTGLDGQKARTFAYPCCNVVIGMPGLAKRLLRSMRLDRTRLMGAVMRHGWLDLGSTETSYEALAAELFLAARIGGERFSAGPGYPPCRSAVPCVSLDGKSMGGLSAILDAFFRQDGGWLVFMVHGVGGGHRLSCDRAVFESLLGSLQSHTTHVLTVRDAAKSVYGREDSDGCWPGNTLNRTDSP